MDEQRLCKMSYSRVLDALEKEGPGLIFSFLCMLVLGCHSQSNYVNISPFFTRGTQISVCCCEVASSGLKAEPYIVEVCVQSGGTGVN